MKCVLVITTSSSVGHQATQVMSDDMYLYTIKRSRNIARVRTRYTLANVFCVNRVIIVSRLLFTFSQSKITFWYKLGTNWMQENRANLLVSKCLLTQRFSQFLLFLNVVRASDLTEGENSTSLFYYFWMCHRNNHIFVSFVIWPRKTNSSHRKCWIAHRISRTVTNSYTWKQKHIAYEKKSSLNVAYLFILNVDFYENVGILRKCRINFEPNIPWIMRKVDKWGFPSNKIDNWSALLALNLL